MGRSLTVPEELRLQNKSLSKRLISWLKRIDGHWEKQWSSKELVDVLVYAVREGNDISPPAYPGSAIQIATALKEVISPRVNKNMRQNVLIAGSISPWVEATVLGTNEIQVLGKVTTTDYQPIVIDHSNIRFVSMEELDERPPVPPFDMVVSFSSIEHDGLGRYGDPINPNGDIAAIGELRQVLKPGGFLLLAVPFSEKNSGTVDGNWHRIYSRDRIDRLSEGFDLIDTVPCTLWAPTRPWENQPIFVLQKQV